MQLNGDEYRHLDDKIDRLVCRVEHVSGNVDRILGGIVVAKWVSGVALTVAVAAFSLAVGK